MTSQRDRKERRSGHGVHHGEADPSGESLDPEQAWRTVAEAGIRRLPLPTPFAVGRVNTYLIEDDPLTLIDSGPNSAKSLDDLERQLATIDRRIEQIELVVATHQHIDHTGLIEIVARRSGAEVAAIDLLGSYLRDYSANAEADDEFSAEMMRRHGIPADLVTALRAVSGNFRAWGSSAEVTRELVDGDRIELANRTLEVQLRPGHSPTDTLFWDAERKLLVGGDHLIAHISSNPLLSRPIDGSGERPQSLLDYIASMRRTRELDAEVIIGGHGEPVTDHVGLIDSRLAMHERRAQKLHRLISEEPLNAHQIARKLWGDVAISQALLTLSEVIGHLDLLVERGLARELDGEVIRFEATG